MASLDVNIERDLRGGGREIDSALCRGFFVGHVDRAWGPDESRVIFDPTGHVEVDESIIIIVAPRHADAAGLFRDAGGGCHVGKSAVAVVFPEFVVAAGTDNEQI